MWNDGYDFPAHSVLYNYVDNSVFSRDGLSSQVRYLYEDQNGMNLEIFNPDRLRRLLFKEIRKKYNERIEKYNLTYPHLAPKDQEKFKIVKIKLSDENKSFKPISGHYNVFPRTFVCKKCGHFKSMGEEEWEKFDPHKCPKCGGEYEQISILKYCETCGSIVPLYQSCTNPEHGRKYLKLTRLNKENLATWEFKCDAPGCKWHRDVLSPKCDHGQSRGNPISFEEPTKYIALNVNQGGIYQSCVMTTVDLPKGKTSEFIDEITLGLYYHYWDKFNFKKGKEMKFIQKYLTIYEEITEDEDMAELESEENIKMANDVHEVLEQIKEKFGDNSIYEINDYMILKGDYATEQYAQNVSFNEVVKDSEDLKKEYSQLKEDFKIEEMTYLPDIHLISSSYGIIKGINKFYEEGFKPHFEPHYNYKDKHYTIYSYPFETEGIMFDLDKIKLANWVIKNSSKNYDEITSIEDAKNFLINLPESSAEYDKLKTLIHTFSHMLLKRISLHTGLNHNSCSELLYPKSGAFLIYSTSNINIGGFSFVFYNSMFEWFNDIKSEIEECIFDPSCIEDGGACFSCLYLPEFVCCDFNHHLDRDAFLGTTKWYNEGFWK